MSSPDHRVMPVQVAQLVNGYAASELADSRKYSNRQPLDDSGIFSLHRLAAEIYAAGFTAGEQVAEERHHGERIRALDAEREAK